MRRYILHRIHKKTDSVFSPLVARRINPGCKRGEFIGTAQVLVTGEHESKKIWG